MVAPSTPPEPMPEAPSTGADPLPRRPAASTSQRTPSSLADRYDVSGELGRGGLAVVYRVHDAISGRSLALKHFALPEAHPSFRTQAAAFEREFHTLVQLSHPRIIEVYDFGFNQGSPYYTMELLDGKDLKQCSPLPWREACSLLYDVCSSLALLHSRRLVHRDVSPNNVRRTPAGTAKLMDFGALSPTGTAANVTGTPPFVPPESLHRSTLDGRSDLFSLGATLYYALTGSVPYSARSLGGLLEAWKLRPPVPSAFAPDIPPALDALVLSLVSLDPAARPHSAFEVMHRLASIADLDRDEDAGVSQAYLSTPVVVGRDDCLAQVRAHLNEALRAERPRGRGLLIEGAAGLGRSRVLDLCAIEAKTSGAAVLRVNAGAARADAGLAVGYALGTQVLESMPELAQQAAKAEKVSEILFGTSEPQRLDGDARPALAVPSAGQEAERVAFQGALARWLLRVARGRPLAVLIDDADQADQASQALLASLALSVSDRPLLLLATARSDASVEDPNAFAVLRRECTSIELSTLSAQESRTLVVSLFGDVPHVGLVADRLYEAARGNPGETVDLVRFLLDSGAVRYQDGGWVLPGQLSSSQLPTGALETCSRVVEALSEDARAVAQLFSLASYPTLSRRDLSLAASQLPTERLDAAITELLSQRVLVEDDQVYRASRSEWHQALMATLDDATRRVRHRQLAAVYGAQDSLRLEWASHLLACGEEERGLDTVLALLDDAIHHTRSLSELSNMDARDVALVYDKALTVAERLKRKPRELYTIRHGLLSIATLVDESHYLRVADTLLAQLKHDSGWDEFQRLTEIADPGARVKTALARVAQRYATTPEAERVYDPQNAIRGLCHYTVNSIALGSRMQDVARLQDLPALLEPFAVLSPMLRALWGNASATAASVCHGRPQEARRLWTEVLELLSHVPPAELVYVESLRKAILYGLGLIEAQMGFAEAERTARMLDDDPMQAVSGLTLRKVARLHRGDFVAAERLRKRAEKVALHSNVRSMFSATLQAELTAYALAMDLAGLRQVAQALEPLAARFEGWRGFKCLADGCIELTSGRFAEALAAFDRGLSLCGPGSNDASPLTRAWLPLEAAAIETLVNLNRAEEAVVRGVRVLELCTARRVDSGAFAVRRALARAEAKLGDYRGASQRLEGVIEEMKALRIVGLQLGATYETRARIAIWFEDEEGVAEYGRLTAREFRYGEGSSLGARYERLMDEARSAGRIALPQLVGFKTKMVTTTTPSVPIERLVQQKLAETSSTEERSMCVLQMLCAERSTSAGHLYLRTADGLKRAASIGGAPEASLEQEALDALRDLEDGTLAHDVTVTLSGDADTAMPAGMTCISLSNEQFHLLPLRGMGARGHGYIGAALLDAAGLDESVTVTTEQLTEAVASYLLRVGDVEAAERPGGPA